MIVLHSTNCPRCIILEKKLKEKGVEFSLNQDIDRMQELGILSAPTLEIQDEDGSNKLLNYVEAIKYVNNLK